jgi:hypothetical protein
MVLLPIALAIVYSDSCNAVANHGDVLFDFYIACFTACPTTGHQELIAIINREELFDFMRVWRIIIVVELVRLTCSTCIAFFYPQCQHVHFKVW